MVEVSCFLFAVRDGELGDAVFEPGDSEFQCMGGESGGRRASITASVHEDASRIHKMMVWMSPMDVLPKVNPINQREYA